MQFDGHCLAEWASNNSLHLIFNPKEPKTFLSARWVSDTNSDLHRHLSDDPASHIGEAAYYMQKS